MAEESAVGEDVFSENKLADRFGGLVMQLTVPPTSGPPRPCVAISCPLRYLYITVSGPPRTTYVALIGPPRQTQVVPQRNKFCNA